MKKNRRIIVVLLVAILAAVSLVGCGNGESQVQGIVKKQDFSGNLHIELEVEDEENDKLISVPAFGYWCGLVTPGTEVICSIKKWAKQGRDISVNVDPVEYESAA